MTDAGDILKNLNPRQAEAVEHFFGPLLIVAGAGTGKTRVITHRIAYLIDVMEANPANILGLTFTNKSAEEMRERVAAMSGPGAREVTLCTFHSFCNRILRRHISHIDGRAPGFSIYDESDSLSCVRRILKTMDVVPGIQVSPNDARSVISKAKNLGRNPLELADGDSGLEVRIEAIFDAYQAMLKENNAFDFDDLLTETVSLFRNCPDVLERTRRQYAFILVDEYQDTNLPQYEILKFLAAPNGNITVVGDPDQSIYSWRGANLENMFSFERDFNDVKVVTIEQNYRSKQKILDAANSLIVHNRGVREKKLWSQLGDGATPFLFMPWDEREEAHFILRELDYLISEGYRPDDVAVMLRTKAQTRVLEETLKMHAIPYVVIGAVSFYQRMEVKDVVAYLRVIENPRDIESFFRIANVPKRGIGDKTVEKLQPLAREAGSMFELLNEGVRENLPSKIIPLLELLLKYRNKRDKKPLTDFIKDLLDEAGYWGHLSGLERKDGIDRRENVEELISMAGRYERSDTEATLQGFLSGVALYSDNTEDEFENAEGRVKLITLHSAKGLEFPVVFIAGAEESLLPHHSALEDASELDEERRLCYVGVTRAKEFLYFSACRSRMVFGRVKQNKPSRFLLEIGEDNLSLLKAPRGGESTPGFFDEVEGEEDEADGEDFETYYEPLDDEESEGKLRKKVRAAPVRHNYHAGERVVHEHYGEGCIVHVAGYNARVAFPGRGAVRVDLRNAPLKPLFE